MPRPRRKPGAPGRVEFICTGRDDPDHGRHHLEWFQMVMEDGRVRLPWMPHGRTARVPVTGHRRGAGQWQTADIRCGRCRRHLKREEEDLVEVIEALAEHQGTHGEPPVIVDISRIEHAL